MTHTGAKSKCVNCGKRIYQQVAENRYRTMWWQHATGDQSCEGLMLKYAFPTAKKESPDA